MEMNYELCFIVYIQTEDMYVGMYVDMHDMYVKTRFDASNHELDRPLSRRKKIKND